MPSSSQSRLRTGHSLRDRNPAARPRALGQGAECPPRHGSGCLYRCKTTATGIRWTRALPHRIRLGWIHDGISSRQVATALASCWDCLQPLGDRCRTHGEHRDQRVACTGLRDRPSCCSYRYFSAACDSFASLASLTVARAGRAGESSPSLASRRNVTEVRHEA